MSSLFLPRKGASLFFRWVACARRFEKSVFEFRKLQQGWPTPQAMPGWPPRQVHPNQPPPQHQQPRGAPMMHRGGGGWQPNGMVPGQTGGKPQGMGGWDGGQAVGPQGHRPYPQMAVPRGGMPQQPRGPNRGGYPPQIDMSIPPPVDAVRLHFTVERFLNSQPFRWDNQ